MTTSLRIGEGDMIQMVTNHLEFRSGGLMIPIANWVVIFMMITRMF